ncbi:MAG: hypothetical protein WDN28_33260 [Chthoniobacter sp.]
MLPRQIQLCSERRAGAGAQGGSLTVSSGKFLLGTPLNPTLIVTQGTLSLNHITSPGQGVIGSRCWTVWGNAIVGTGYFAANTFLNGGGSIS